MSYLTIAKPAYGTLEGFQKLMSAQGIGQGEPEGLQARYVADVGDGIRVVAVWETKPHADRFLEERLAHALATALPARLTAREVEVLRLVVRGMSNREVADSLVLSQKTVGRHLESIYAKIDVSTRVGATLFAIEHELVANLAAPVRR